jgi:hypothetical protein
LRHYRTGFPVPAPFAPLRKISNELLDRMDGLPGSALPEVFQELRRARVLPPLLPLIRATCPTPLPWENLRALFQDFRGEALPETGTQG